MSPRAKLILCMGLIASSLMGWEILLTRLASLRYHFHFGHLAVSNGMLGVGVAATWLGVTRTRWADAPLALLNPLLKLNIVMLGLAIAVLYVLPVHLGQMNLSGTSSFGVFALASLLPFLTCGAVMGLLLSGWPSDADRIYGADLIAAGSACLWVPLSLPVLGMAGALAAIMLCALAALCLFTPTARLTGILVGGLVIAASTVAPPAPSKIDRPILESTWTPISRVDVVSVTEPSIRARGTPPDPTAIPEQVELMQDGSASTLLSNHSRSNAWPTILADTLFAAATRLRQGGHVLVIGFGGGDDVWASLGQGAATVTAVDLHKPVLDAHRVHRPEWSAKLLNHPGVRLEVAEGRHTLKRSTSQFDVVQMTGIDTWAALSSGAFMLAENHLYTTDAFGEMLDRLSPGGILQITRMAAEMEALRVLVQLRKALSVRQDTPFSEAVMVIGSSDHQVATLVRRDGFDASEVDALTSWADGAGFHIHHAPGRASTDLISTFVRTPDPEGFVASFPRLITPTTDDSPYFFQFTRWTRPDLALSTIKEPTYISQGNPMWVVGLGGYTLAVACLLLFGPRLGRSRARQHTTYFASLGLGYVLIELGLMHKLSLMLGHPMLSFSVVLGGMLLSTGLGCLVAHRVHDIRWVAAVVAIFAALTHLTMPALTDWAVSLGTPARIGLGLLICSPIGFVLGIPFVYGLRRIPAPAVPWAWATNALFSVAGATLVILVSMTWSFSGVLACGALAYGVAALAAPRSTRIVS